jgi:cytochrome o ubiquinol oxidase subunit 2
MTRWQVFPRMTRMLALFPLLLLSGCSDKHYWLFDPKGPIASAELHYMILDVLVMLVVIIPVTALTIWVLWRYRAAAQARHEPGWAHSNVLEFVVWGVPLVIVAILGYYSYVGIHAVNPYGPEVLAKKSVVETTRQGIAPLEVDVISTDWQWLFVYPKLHIASANELVVPTHVPVHFRLTSTTVTNNFFIPQLVGQIYAMPGMRTKQAMIADHTGEYHGLAATLSGPGFSWMDFKVKALNEQQFGQWVAGVKGAKAQLTYAAFDKFAQPTVNTSGKSVYFANVQPGLFKHVIQEVKAGKVYPTPYAFTENMQAPEFTERTN